ncbi:mRNA interferase toxin RelE [Paraburkholderia caffeinitolerans]|uniref:mRNA interferase toxin RelE n=1 Tax=Paraburkholderia caffeinitolerans TaxID=1723730 RepID=A0A6J5FII5_9BURK|nr:MULTISPECIES: type II toxin-antitoxin system RelE/ParE family toxin [Paraburkholderia]CAB3780475.1 mRNA interferase toxin RelE [Paraburkholderia caffeinitolerans]
MKTYELKFHKSALKDWQHLDSTVRTQLRKKLVERLIAPRVDSARLSSMPDCYKIKLAASGYRLVYQVIDGELVVLVIAIGKREADQAYRKARTRLD